MIYQRVLERGRVTPDQRVPVDKWLQHAAIVAVSRELLEQVRSTHPYGPRLYAIASEFGRHIRRVLDEAPMIKKQGDETPPMCPRLEVEGLDGGLAGTLDAEEQDIATWLIRRAVFIELNPGSSRHGNTQTLRWQLRRVYLPAFGAALSKNDAEKWDDVRFKLLLRDPQAAVNAAWRQRRDNARTIRVSDQPMLFPVPTAQGDGLDSDGRGRT